MWDETFVERTRSSDRQLPGHVEKELRAYLECGILAHGFLRVRCEDCAEDRVVAFSCQRRSFCPSCMGRRMADTAARLTDEVLPQVPVRQWVLSLPYEIRYRLAWDGELVGALLSVFLRVVYGWYRRQARAQGYEDGRCGSVTFVQRFGSSLNLNPHAHVLMIDGVYIDGEDGLEFVAAPTLGDDDVQQTSVRPPMAPRRCSSSSAASCCSASISAVRFGISWARKLVSTRRPTVRTTAVGQRREDAVVLT